MSGRPSRREVLADDVRRLAGLAEAAVGEAAYLDLEVSEDVARCVAAWRHWARRLAQQDDSEP
jgi:hypothetical protein